MAPPQAEAPARTVHLVCKTHLDVGFTDLASVVVDRYIEGFIPSAVAVAAELRRRGGPERFVWTTGAWLVATYLERAGAAARRQVELAIEAGDIAWHALPFTLHSELCDPSLYRHGLTISRRLDERFGRRTIAAKATDVPGHTRGVVPLLAEAGVEFFHIGVNPACPAPEVPPVFRWASPDGAEVVVAYQRGGYGGTTTVPGAGDALVVAHTDDNAGPQTVEQVLATFDRARADHPGATVVASTLDAFAEAIRPHRGELPLVVGEIGDTWVHGVGTDPVKVARFRAVSRARAGALAEGVVATDTPAVARASDDLLLVAEHTWGLDEKVALPDDRRYRADDLARLRAEPAGRAFEASWAEQRAYVDRAVEALSGTAAGPAVEAELALLAVVGPDRTGLSAVDPDRPVPVGGARIVVDGRTGALTSLVPDGHRDLAGPGAPLGRFGYQTFDGADYERFRLGYNRPAPADEWWALLDYTKPGIDDAGATSRWWAPESVSAVAGGDRLVVALDMPAPAVEACGCPRVVTLEWRFPPGSGRAELVVQWQEKRACRLPEASWMAFVPAVDQPDRWLFDKLGCWVSPLDVVPRGGRGLHAVGDGGARHEGRRGRLTVSSPDAALVAPGRPRLLDPGDDLPDLAGGLHWNLHNNVWGTNFPMWVEGPARFRFVVGWA